MISMLQMILLHNKLGKLIRVLNFGEGHANAHCCSGQCQTLT